MKVDKVKPVEKKEGNETLKYQYKIRQLRYWYNKFSLRSIANRFDVSHQAVKNALTGKSKTEKAMEVCHFVDSMDLPMVNRGEKNA
jgi:predicted DNA-binding protein YlxM (UPF0122 family)